MAKSDDGDWRSWNRFDWSNRLLDSYFGRPQLGPVRSLNVTDPGLAAAAGQPSDMGEQVREALISSVLRASGADRKDYFDVGLNGFRHPTEVPYLAHLIVSCVSAVGSGNNDEAGFIDGFLELIDHLTHQGRLDKLAFLWAELANWLAKRDTFRSLDLPDPGGWTRIGYSVRLAFPSRADQRALRRCFERDELVGINPSTGSVITSVARAKATFSERFWDRFDDFRLLHSAGVSQDELVATPFWTAVELADGGRGTASESAMVWTMLADDTEFDLSLTLASKERPSDGFLPVKQNELDDREWPFVVEFKSWSQMVESLAAGTPRAPLIAEMVRGGVLPFILNPHGQLVLARRSLLPEVEVLLAEDRVVDDLRRLFPAPKATARRSSTAPGWSVVRGLHLTAISVTALAGTSLAGCQLLQEAPVLNQLRIVRGVPVEDGYLGHAGFLPAVAVNDAIRVTLAGPTGHPYDLDLVEGSWILPRVDLDGEFEVIADLGQREICRTVNFYARPTSERPRQPVVIEGYLLEHLASAVSMSNGAPLAAPSLDEIETFQADDDEYLGRDVGRFVASIDEATWVVTRFGTWSFLRRRGPGVDVTPEARVQRAGLRRSWRTKLARSSSHPADREASSIGRTIAARKWDTLPLRADPTTPPRTARQPTAQDRTARAVEAVVATTNRRLGFTPVAWRQLLTSELDADATSWPAVDRAWKEAGLVRDLLNVRSGSRLIAAVPPRLCTFRTDGWYGATLLGTMLPSTRRRVLASAQKMHCLVSEQTGVSPLVPPILSLRAEAPEHLEALGRQLDLPLVPVPRQPPFLGSRDLTASPPLGYEPADFSRNLPGPPGVEITRFWRPRAPQFWLVESDAYRTWLHHEHSALFWARMFVGAELVSLGDGQLILEDAVMPLALATWLVTLSGVPPGTDPSSGKYSIPLPSLSVGTEAIAFLQEYVGRVLLKLAPARQGGVE